MSYWQSGIFEHVRTYLRCDVKQCSSQLVYEITLEEIRDIAAERGWSYDPVAKTDNCGKH